MADSEKDLNMNTFSPNHIYKTIVNPPNESQISASLSHVEETPKSKGRPAKSLVYIDGQPSSHCNICNKLFTNSSALAKHRLAHSEERKYVCSTCNRAFKRPDHLSGHIMTHAETKPYACQMEGCLKSFCDSRSLRRHHNRFHLPFIINGQDMLMKNNPCFALKEDIGNITSLVCPECDKTFKNASAINGHMRLHRRTDAQQLFQPSDPYNHLPNSKNLINNHIDVKDLSNFGQFNSSNDFNYLKSREYSSSILGNYLNSDKQELISNILKLKSSINYNAPITDSLTYSQKTFLHEDTSNNLDLFQSNDETSNSFSNIESETDKNQKFLFYDLNIANNNEQPKIELTGQQTNMNPAPYNNHPTQRNKMENSIDFLSKFLNCEDHYSKPISKVLSMNTAINNQDDDMILTQPIKSPIYRSQFKRVERSKRPLPLYIPPSSSVSTDSNLTKTKTLLPPCLSSPATPFAFHSKLRSPRISFAENIFVSTPYTPPPMLSPYRTASGLYWHLKKDAFLPVNDIVEEVIVSDKIEDAIETDISPHINIGEAYQANIPHLTYLSEFNNDLHLDHLLWHPTILQNTNEEEVNLYLDFSSSLCVAYNGSNKELAYHLLYLTNGNITDAVKIFLQEQLKLNNKRDITSYKYQDTSNWNKSEIEIFTHEINLKGKDFYALASKLKEKSVKECVEFYYTWKKCFSKFSERSRRVRKKFDKYSD